ncbi:hypothetical protein Misp06_00551 [Microbulbifer sp. NBRC 101763]|uniref:reprolysin-like metallopeptidase n=1 Tax=Microbulbifer TaxID=48073 RepID=UPI00036F77F6|nr:zinc-dependent metalloprotease family protein [Microbulbifer variabilis]
MSLKKNLAATIAALTICGAASAETVDIAIMYTTPAADHTGDITTKIDNYISYANNSFSRNGVDIQLRLVDTWLASHDDLRVTEDNLDLITFHGSVNDWRSSVRADMVVLLGKADEFVDQNGDRYRTCGIAWVGQGSNGTMYSSAKQRAYSVTGVDCGYNTFVHELGHNMGLNHSTKQGSTPGVYSYGLGYGVDNSFATIMAYPHVFGTTTQFDIFSNPDWAVCNNLPCGERRNGVDISNAQRALAPIVDDIAGYY